MRYNTKKSSIISVLSSALVLTLFVCGAQAFAEDNTSHQGKALTSPSAAVMTIAKGQVYKPPKDIYKEQC